MTIKFVGHVEKVGIGHRNHVELTLWAEHMVCKSNPIVVEVSRAAADAYRPGMAVEFTISPRADAAPVNFDSMLK